MDDSSELRHIRISVITHVAVAVVMGWFSLQVQLMYRTLYSVGLGVVILIALGYALERVTGKKGVKWWLGNGAVIYLFIWLISWTFFLNL